ncbi:MAG: restriction endonuclease, partial [Clostridia bacterium]|nr:restriction endonuclease [Clostridia bacterium]
MSALFLAVSIGYFCIFPTLSALGIITIICSVGFLIYGIVYTVIDNNEKAEKHKREEILLKSNIKQIDNMDGVTFENYLAMVFKQKGYNVTLTKTTGDYGVDLILSSKDNELTEKIIIQAKRYSKKVPISAVQQISAARDYYHTNDAWVITNNYFTQPAINLAKANDIKLIDRDMLAMLITSIQPNRTITHENPTIDNYANNEPVFQGSISKSDPVSIEMATT